MVKEGSGLLKGGECGCMSPSKGDHYRVGSIAFLFVPEKLDISCSKGRILIVNGYHVDVVVSI